MKTTLLAAMAALCLMTLPAASETRQTLGWGRLFVNDFFGDGKDRWRTGSYTVSMVRGPKWAGEAPYSFGSLLEFRARSEIIAPASLTVPNPADRRYAGVLSLGVHSHVMRQGWETSIGLDLVVIGPQTGASRLQETIHDWFGMPAPVVSANQIGDRVIPTVLVETGRSFSLGEVHIRPFAEAQAGVEDLVRAGVDVTIGSFGQGGLMVREPSSGQRYRAVRGNELGGLSAIIGGDVARVWDSAFLPAGGVQPTKTRTRLRAGLHWQGERAEVFYGATWAGKEFVGQPEGQVLGAISLRLRF